MRSVVKRARQEQSGISPWWQESEGEGHHQLWALVEHCEGHYEQRRRTETLMHLAMYGDRYAFKAMAGGWEGQRLKFNLTKAVIDTTQAEIAAMRPRPTILTSRGDWGQKRKAQAMELAVAGEYEECDVYPQSSRGFLDAAKTGTTGFHVYSSGWRPRVELLQPGCILVDPVEAMYGDPKAIYRIALVPRYEVLGRWGQDDTLHKAIEQAPSDDPKHWFPWLPTDTLVDHLLVVEAHREPDPDDWRNPDDGRHVIAIKGATLVDEPWDRPSPYTFYRYDLESGDFFGRGLAANLMSLQVELNITLRKIQDCIELAAGPRVWVEASSKVDVDQIDNVPGSILTYTGAIPPQVELASTVPPQLLEHAESIIRRGFEQEGVSMMSAMARKPAGLNSGAALREHNDIESKRFRIHSQAFERWVGVDTAERVIEEKRWIAQQPNAKPPELTAESTRGRTKHLRTIKWADADLEPGSYKMRVFPTSSLPSTPAGRTAMVEQWMSAGLIDRDQAMQLLDFQDTDDFTRRQMADADYVCWHVEVMLEDGEYMPPSPIQNVDKSLALARESALLAEMEGAPEDRTDLVYRYMDDLRAYQERAQQAAMAQQPQQPQPEINQATATQMATAQA